MLARPETRIFTKRIPLASLFIDAHDAKLFSGDKKVPHMKADGPGYQRDPWIRSRWIEERAESFDPHLLRHLEVSPRGDGTYAIIDGGGRFLLVQYVGGIFDMECRVHEGLTRQQEAELFVKMDKQKVGLSAVNIFQADVAAGDEESIAIAEAVLPYQVAPNGAGSFRGVGQLRCMFHTTGPNFISKVSRIVAQTWGGYDGGFKRGAGVPVDGQAFMAVAIALTGGVPEGDLRAAMRDNFPVTLKAKATQNLPPMKTQGTGLVMALKLIQLARGKSPFKAMQNKAQNSKLAQAYIGSNAYGERHSDS
jgi:hypothetical protein